MKKFNKFSEKKSGRGDSKKFGRKRPESADRRESRGPSHDKRTAHEVTCDKCGKSCEVPFKPTKGKPVYCSNCFRKEDSPRQESGSGYGSYKRKFRSRDESSESNQESDKFSTEFEQINAKLDKILKLLSK